METNKIAFIVAVPITAQAFLLDHMRVLRRYCQVHLLMDFHDEKTKHFFEDEGIICHQIPICRAIDIFADFKCLCYIIRIFRKESFDCVHSVTPKAGFLTAVSGFLVRIPHRIHIFTGQVWATKKGFIRFFLKLFDKIIVALDTQILVDGIGQRQFLIKEKIVSESNSIVPAFGSIAGIDLRKYSYSEAIRKSERRRYFFDNNDIVYVFLGRLNYDKGIDVLFRAFNILVPECPNAKLLLLGFDEENYDKKAENYEYIHRGCNYFFPGVTNTPQNSLQAGDVFVLPSLREGFGVSVLEAQALCMPVITTDVYGVVDASEEGKTGLRFKVNDHIGLYQCMKEYYCNESKRKAHGIAGRERVELFFSNEIVSNSWLEIYRRMLKFR